MKHNKGRRGGGNDVERGRAVVNNCAAILAFRKWEKKKVETDSLERCLLD